MIGVYREPSGSHVETNSPEEQNLLDHFAALLRGSEVEIATNCLAARFSKNLWYDLRAYVRHPGTQYCLGTLPLD